MLVKTFELLCLLPILFGKISASPKFSINVEDYLMQEQILDSEDSQELDIIPSDSVEPTSIEDDLEQKYRSKIEAKVLEIANGLASRNKKARSKGYG